MPVPAPARIADADCLGMRRRISRLHAEVVTARDNPSRAVRQYRPDGQAAFAETEFRLLQCLLQERPIVRHERS